MLSKIKKKNLTSTKKKSNKKAIYFNVRNVLFFKCCLWHRKKARTSRAFAVTNKHKFRIEGEKLILEVLHKAIN